MSQTLASEPEIQKRPRPLPVLRAAAGFDVGEEGAADADVVGELVGGGSASFAEGLDRRSDALALFGTFRAKIAVGSSAFRSHDSNIAELTGTCQHLTLEHSPTILSLLVNLERHSGNSRVVFLRNWGNVPLFTHWCSIVFLATLAA